MLAQTPAHLSISGSNEVVPADGAGMPVATAIRPDGAVGNPVMLQAFVYQTPVAGWLQTLAARGGAEIVGTAAALALDEAEGAGVMDGVADEP